MSKPRISPQTTHVLLAMAFVVGCTAMSFGFSQIFPQGERWLADWQLSHRPSHPVASSVVLVRAERNSAALCGEGRWNLTVLQATFLALHQAGASVIAPLMNGSMPIPSECGGLTGLVQLAEVTKHVGSVVYPDSVPSVLAQNARGTGALGWVPDEDRGVRGFTFDSSSLDLLRLPFGLAVASSTTTSVTAPMAGSFLYVPSTMSQKGEVLFPTHRFTGVWKLIQARNQESLVRLFQGKMVFLFSSSLMSQGLFAPIEFSVPVAFLHVKLANAYLTNSWVVPAPFVVVFFMTVGLGWLAIVPMFRGLARSRLGFFIGFVMVLFASGFLFLGFQWGWMWPLFSMGLAVGMTMIGIVVWGFWQSRATVQQRIVQGEQQLTRLKQKLVGKQQDVRQLNEQLYDAQLQTNQSVIVIEALQISQDQALSQLGISQGEIKQTRRKIDRLQEELHDLRQQAPASLPHYPSEPLTVDHQELIQECEAHHIVTRDPVVFQLFHNLKKAAATHIPILLLGETGTGKEVFAKAVHALSPRRQGPFISVNMAAIRAELFEGELFGHVKGAFTGAVGRTGFLESAHNGTLFLDEVGDLPLNLQAKLLRFLEDGRFHRVGQSSVTHVDVRVIAATNRDLQQEVHGGRYREDLYYRLRSIVLTLPPLRTRSQADHVLLAQFFLKQCAQFQHRTDLSFTQGALDAIVAHQWPGNIRELRQTVAQAVALADGSVITETDLNLEGPKISVVSENWVKEDLGRQEDAMVLDCLRLHKFDMQATAATLGWDRGTVTQRLKGLGFQALMEYQGDVHAAARALAGDERFVRVVEGRLREYANNLVPGSKRYGSVEEAIADCRKRFRNLPERHFPAVEQLLHARFAAS
ncbi:MAG: sigma 54-interacting transcriptional regulator [Nitrospirota bacterium]|nr:sigma 54-interacting transcriptional regulator [Nitrospirota bacterium]